MPIDVIVNYPMSQYPALDEQAHIIVGRYSDFSGTDFKTRDLGWECESLLEADTIANKLKTIGLSPVVGYVKN